ncbi:hypothetical protein BJ878DRAFT_287624 [Calycina marina]|uniref:BTB domain-containing protein n=1 Tax=Calycina marina TaxID=1763456 RepID=A0A9P7ZCA0_9HELO|nr:hypothetical protein BJ878DRAFT_287624 [Calycina marina]
MAPAPPKAAQANGNGNGNRPGSQGLRKSVVPAIPLNYLHSRKQKLAAAEEARMRNNMAQVATQQVAPALPTPPPAPASTTPPTEATPVVANSSIKDHVYSTGGETFEDLKDTPEDTQSVTSTIPGTEEETQAGANAAFGKFAPQDTPGFAHTQESSAASGRPSFAFRSPFYMPPAFVPASQYPSNTTQDPVMKIQSPQHRPQRRQNGHGHPDCPSNGNNRFTISNSSSPAPPSSAGFAPANTYPPSQFAGFHVPQSASGGQMGYAATGQMGPPAPMFIPNGTFTPGEENYTRGQMSGSAASGYSPAYTPSFENQLPPPKDRSVQQNVLSSQRSSSSPPAEYGTAPQVNCTTDYASSISTFAPPLGFPAITGSGPPQPYMEYTMRRPRRTDHYDRLILYIQSLFDSKEQADCTVELHQLESRTGMDRLVLQIPGHTLLLARSSKLRALMDACPREDHRILRIESQDRFVTAAGFKQAIDNLYCGAFLDHEYKPQLPKMQRLEHALSYVAAGHLLDNYLVRNQGIEVAIAYLDWSTLEIALDFALDGGLSPRWEDRAQPRSTPTHGPSSDSLLYRVAEIITVWFPADLDIDLEVADPVGWARLPRSSSSNQVATQTSQGRQLLQFGDIDIPTNSTQRVDAPNRIHRLLSSILLNLPFPVLKHILDSSILGVCVGYGKDPNSSLTKEIRNKAIRDIIKERELRRKACLADAPPDADSPFYYLLYLREYCIDHPTGVEMHRELLVS